MQQGIKGKTVSPYRRVQVDHLARQVLGAQVDIRPILSQLQLQTLRLQGIAGHLQSTGEGQPRCTEQGLNRREAQLSLLQQLLRLGNSARQMELSAELPRRPHLRQRFRQSGRQLIHGLSQVEFRQGQLQVHSRCLRVIFDPSGQLHGDFVESQRRLLQIESACGLIDGNGIVEGKGGTANGERRLPFPGQIHVDRVESDFPL